LIELDSGIRKIPVHLFDHLYIAPVYVVKVPRLLIVVLKD
jgi:hypothetical protein